MSLTTEASLQAQIDELTRQNEAMKNRGGVYMKVSEKGGVSLYGLGRWPVTLYKEQWAVVLNITDEIRAFIKENDSKLKTKPERGE